MNEAVRDLLGCRGECGEPECVEGFASAAADEPGDVLAGLPPDLVRVLRDPTIILPQDQAVWEAIASWANAPSNTASADLPAAADEPGERE